MATLTQQDVVRITSASPTSSGWCNGKCPAHDDSQASLGIGPVDNNGSFGLKCHAGCSYAQIVAVLESKTGKKFPGKNKSKPASEGFTLMELEKLKCIPAMFLGVVYRIGQRQWSGRPAVTFAYYDEAGECTGIKLRLSTNSHDALWVPGSHTRPMLYGVDVLTCLQAEQHWDMSVITLVEGETDAFTLTFNGIPALGIPGKEGWNSQFAKLRLLREAKEILVVKEPGEGTASTDRLIEQVKESFPNKSVLVLNFEEPIDDPSALWLDVIEQFRKRVPRNPKTMHSTYPALARPMYQDIGEEFDRQWRARIWAAFTACGVVRRGSTVRTLICIRKLQRWLALSLTRNSSVSRRVLHGLAR